MPGHEKTASTSTEPPSWKPNCRPSTVMICGAAFLTTCVKTRRAPRPFGAQRQDELLVQDVERRRADDPRDDAERDQRQRDRGQRHVPQVLDESAVGGGAHRGQPVQLHREDDDEDDAGPVMGHRHADDGDRARELVERATLPERGEQAERHAGAEREHRGRQRQHEAVRERVAHVEDHRAPGGDRLAEIARGPRGRATSDTARAAACRSRRPRLMVLDLALARRRPAARPRSGRPGRDAPSRTR